jgi:hypothetical protein
VRQSLERGEELQELLQQNAPRVDRFRSTQARIQPFRGWAERYCGAFLHPLSFLDELSAEYQSRGGERAEEILADLLDFLHREGTFQTAFDWPQTEGVPVVEEHCLLPPAWSVLPEVMLALSNHRWMESKVSRGTDPGRAYLLRVKLGVSPERLRTRQSQTVLPEAL